MASKFSHNKKRNGGLVYEFLVRQMGRSLIEQDQRGYGESLGIIKRFYPAGSSMNSEREYFNVIRGARGVSSENARKILGIVKDGYGRLDHRKIEIKKSNLIKDINHSFGQGFYGRHRVPEYRLLASIQMFLDGCRPQRTLMESVQGVELEEALVRYMTSVPPVVTESKKEPVDQIVFTLASRRFQQKYADSLSSAQKRLLEGYTRSLVDDPENFRKDLVERRQVIMDDIAVSLHTKEVADDKLMRERLVEASTILSGLDLSVVTEKAVQEMMLFERLDEEIRSDG
jgi:hypothetical protein